MKVTNKDVIYPPALDFILIHLYLRSFPTVDQIQLIVHI